MNYDDEDVKAFIEEREKKLGGSLIWRTYATFFSEIGGERRDWGVFLYSDGRTLVIEDFFRESRILGYAINSKKEKERARNWVKMEIILPLSDITEVSLVSRRSAEKSLKTKNDVSKRATLFNKIFTRTCVHVKAGGRVFFLELPSMKEFKNLVDKKGDTK